MRRRTNLPKVSMGLALLAGCGVSERSGDLAEATAPLVVASMQNSNAHAAAPCAELVPVKGAKQEDFAAIACVCSGTDKDLEFQTPSTTTGTSADTCTKTLNERVDHWCVNQNIPADCSGTCRTGKCKPQGSATGVTTSTTATGVSCSTTTGKCTCACR